MSADAPRMRLLVAEDDPDLRETLGEAFRGEGYDVVLAADGDGAINALPSGDFDVVVTDVQMPGADGLAVLRASKESAPDTEVVVTTGFASVAIAIECLR